MQVDFIPGNERGTVRIFDHQAIDGSGKREGVDLDFLDGNLAIQLLG